MQFLLFNVAMTAWVSEYDQMFIQPTLRPGARPGEIYK